MAEKFDPYYTWLGIPPEDQPPDHYRLLGVRRFENNPEVISNALDQRMVHIRSFQTGQCAAESQQILNELSAAGGCLLNPEKKGAYDRDQRQKDAPKLGRSQSSPQFAKPAALHKSGPIAPVLPASATSAAAGPVVATGAPFIGQPAQPVPAPHMHAPQMPVPAVAPNMPVVVTKPVSTSAPMPGAAGGSAATWLPIVLLAGGGAALLMLGGVVLMGALYAAGAFSSKPDKNPKLAQKPSKEIVKPKELNPVKPPPRENPPRRDPQPRDPAPPPREPTPPVVENVALAPVVANNISASLDLLKDFDRTNKQHMVKGSVSKLRDGYTTTGGSFQQDIMVFPAALPEEYMVETVVERLFDTGRGKDDGVVQGLVVGDQQCLVTVDGFNPAGMRTALDLIDGQRAGKEKDLCEHRGQLLTRRNDTLLQYYVFKDRLAVVCNGKTVLNWTGGMNRLSLVPEFRISDTKALFFGTWQGKYKLKKFEVRAIGPDGAPPPSAIAAASSIPKTPVPDPPPVVVKTPTPSPPPVAAAKFSIPDEKATDTARAELRKFYKQEFSKAQKPDEKLALATQLLNTAKDEKAPETLYALLEEAKDLKLGAGEIAAGLQVVDKLISSFELDPWETKTAALKVAEKGATQLKPRRELADAAHRVGVGAMAAAKFEAAEIAASIANDVAGKAGDKEIKKDALELRIAAEAAKKQQPVAQAAFDKLKANGDDADANETWGRFACLVKRDWSEGPQYLAKGTDATLKEAAALDAGQPTANVDQIAVADKWWQAADKLKNREKDSALLRAREWYEKAFPNAMGLAKDKAKRRIDETAALYAKNNISDSATPRIPGAIPGMVGRLVIDSKDSRVFVKYVPGNQISYDDVVKQVDSKYNVKGRQFVIELAGVLHVPEKMDILVRGPKNGSFGGKTSSFFTFGTPSQLFIQGDDIQKLAGNRDRDGSYKFSLSKGEHLFVWTIGGSRAGTAELNFTNAESKEPLFVFYDQKGENYYKNTYNKQSAPSIGELNFK